MAEGRLRHLNNISIPVTSFRNSRRSILTLISLILWRISLLLGINNRLYYLSECFGTVQTFFNSYRFFCIDIR